MSVNQPVVLAKLALRAIGAVDRELAVDPEIDAPTPSLSPCHVLALNASQLSRLDPNACICRQSLHSSDARQASGSAPQPQG
jgi:hypothetical protein